MLESPRNCLPPVRGDNIPKQKRLSALSSIVLAISCIVAPQRRNILRDLTSHDDHCPRCKFCSRAACDYDSLSCFARHGIMPSRSYTGRRGRNSLSRLGPEVMSSLADLRGHIALLRNDGPHSIQHASGFGGASRPTESASPSAMKRQWERRAENRPTFYISASFLLSRVLMHRAKQPRADSRALPAALQELEDTSVRRYTTGEAPWTAVILNNGKIIGPDHYGLLDSRRGEDAARAEVLAK
jgi:hypothetical protein